MAKTKQDAVAVATRPLSSTEGADYDSTELSVDWDKLSNDAASRLIARLREVAENGAKALAQRLDQSGEIECGCGCGTRFISRHAVSIMAVRDERTGVPYNIFFATSGCVTDYRRAKLMGKQKAE